MILTAKQVKKYLNISQQDLDFLVFMGYIFPVEFKYRTPYLKFNSEDVEKMITRKEYQEYYTNNLLASEIEREWR